MNLVGLTGGIGAGKSTVSALLAQRGALIVDSDLIARELQAPGTAVFARIVERFGPTVLGADGALDRATLAGLVFSDAEALGDLNRIVHPAVHQETAARIAAARGTDAVVILDIPLLTENPRKGLQGIVVVDVPEAVQIERLMSGRGFSEDDARARIAKQARRAARLATATFVVDNRGTIDELAPQIDAVWGWLASLPPLD